MDSQAPSPTTYNVAEAKARLSELLDAALRGEDIVISRNNKPLVKLTPVAERKPRPFGIASHWKIDDEALLAPMDEEDLTDEFGMSLKR
jgi:prevent-host-death family protein